jgi:hypothetical protein
MSVINTICRCSPPFKIIPSRNCLLCYLLPQTMLFMTFQARNSFTSDVAHLMACLLPGRHPISMMRHAATYTAVRQHPAKPLLECGCSMPSSNKAQAHATDTSCLPGWHTYSCTTQLDTHTYRLPAFACLHAPDGRRCAGARGTLIRVVIHTQAPTTYARVTCKHTTCSSFIRSLHAASSTDTLITQATHTLSSLKLRGHSPSVGHSLITQAPLQCRCQLSRCCCCCTAAPFPPAASVPCSHMTAALVLMLMTSTASCVSLQPATTGAMDNSCETFSHVQCSASNPALHGVPMTPSV